MEPVSHIAIYQETIPRYLYAGFGVCIVYIQMLSSSICYGTRNWGTVGCSAVFRMESF